MLQDIFFAFFVLNFYYNVSKYKLILTYHMNTSYVYLLICSTLFITARKSSFILSSNIAFVCVCVLTGQVGELFG